jgi:protein tyrosine/serine phosphatase
MRDAYRQFPILLAEPLRAVFGRLASDPVVDHGSVLVHCAAGKDRTGFAVAMLLSAVGVRRVDIIEDYLRTGAQVALGVRIEDARAAVRMAAGAGPGDEVLAELAAVDAALLEVSFDFIEETFGTVDDYLAGPCGLHPEGREKLAESLTGGAAAVRISNSIRRKA